MRFNMAKLQATQRGDLSKASFAFPSERKLPLEDASHVRNAIVRFDQVNGVSDRQRDTAWTRVEAAAKKFGITIHESNWRELGRSVVG